MPEEEIIQIVFKKDCAKPCKEINSMYTFFGNQFLL